MTQWDYDRFETALNKLACNYLARIEGDELAAYFDTLSRFPIELIEQQFPEALQTHPSFFPKAGELLAMCQALIGTFRRPLSTDSVAAVREMAQCDHNWIFEPEADSSLWAGFDTCSRCGMSKPRVREDAPRRQKEYLRMAIAGAQAPTETDAVQ